MRCPGRACKGTMAQFTRDGTTVDRCAKCDGIWFDARELDAWLAEDIPADEPPEERIPERGTGARPCPRCKGTLDHAGWTGLVLDRCRTCRGLFVEARELVALQHDVPDEAHTFEARFMSACVSAGWTLLSAKGLVLLVIRILR